MLHVLSLSVFLFTLIAAFSFLFPEHHIVFPVISPPGACRISKVKGGKEHLGLIQLRKQPQKPFLQRKNDAVFLRFQLF